MPDYGDGRAFTPEELRDDFMDSCRNIVDYWADEKLMHLSWLEEATREFTIHERLSGVLHSILCLVDGVSSGFPCALTLVADPHPDDKAFRQEEGDNWVEPGTELNAGDYLHDLIYNQGSWFRKS